MRELKRYRLRATARPAKWQARLANVVMLIDEEGKHGYQYFNFDESFILAVGMKLRVGVSERNPAVIKVEYSPTIGKWLVGAQYLDQREPPVILWMSDTRPLWTIRPGTRKNSCGTSSPSTASSVAAKTP